VAARAAVHDGHCTSSVVRVVACAQHQTTGEARACACVQQRARRQDHYRVHLSHLDTLGRRFRAVQQEFRHQVLPGIRASSAPERKAAGQQGLSSMQHVCMQRVLEPPLSTAMPRHRRALGFAPCFALRDPARQNVSRSGIDGGARELEVRFVCGKHATAVRDS